MWTVSEMWNVSNSRIGQKVEVLPEWSQGVAWSDLKANYDGGAAGFLLILSSWETPSSLSFPGFIPSLSINSLFEGSWVKLPKYDVSSILPAHSRASRKEPYHDQGAGVKQGLEMAAAEQLEAADESNSDSSKRRLSTGNNTTVFLNGHNSWSETSNKHMSNVWFCSA